jgi:hypothetical protein
MSALSVDVSARMVCCTVESLQSSMHWVLQGGRDKLGWVRQLVRYTETHPILVPPSDGRTVEDDDVESLDGASGGRIRTTVCPRRPPLQSNMHLLAGWMVRVSMRRQMQREKTASWNLSQVFPSLNPARREDVVLLQSWLKDTMAQVTAEFGDRGTATVQVPVQRD